MSGISSIPSSSATSSEQIATSYSDSVRAHESPVDPPAENKECDAAHPPIVPCIHLESCLQTPFLSSISTPPKVPRRRYQVLSIDPLSSREIEKPSSGSGDRYKSNLSSSSASVPFPESNPSPLPSPSINFLSQESRSYQSDPSSSPSQLAQCGPSPFSKIPSLNLRLLPPLPDSIKPEPIQPNAKHTPIRETPGDISSRYHLLAPHGVDGPQSVHFVDNQSPLSSGKKKPSPAPYLFMKYAKRANTPTILQQTRSSSSSSSNMSTPVLSPRPFEGTLSEVHLITDMKKKFSEDTGAKTIAAYLAQEENREENIKDVLAVLLPYHKMKKDKRIEQRWNLLLTAILLHLECADLIYAFLQQSEIGNLRFAAIVTNGFRLKKTPPMEIVHIISLYTQKDLEKEKADDTLFRSDTLSTSLLSSYGHYLLTDLLEQSEKTIVRYWRRKAPGLLYLNYQKIHQSLLKSQKGFCDLELQQQNKLCAQIMQRNKEHCREFLIFFLTYFYKQPLPAACQDLLSTRHNQIYLFIKEKTLLSPEEALKLAHKTALSAEQIHELAQKGTTTLSPQQAQRKSEERIGADLFLRIINPYLMMISNELSEHHCLTSLSKMIQTISNHAPPELPKLEESKEEEINLFEEDLLFNELYGAFEETHRNYIDKNFHIRSFPAKPEDVVQNI